MKIHLLLPNNALPGLVAGCRVKEIDPARIPQAQPISRNKEQATRNQQQF
jgi:hypothetical protein